MSRQLQNIRQSSVVNVKDYGATGDGVTDDTVAIQKAVTVAYAANGGKVIFPTGNYRVVGTININENVAIEGITTTNSLNKGSIITHTPSSPNTDLFYVSHHLASNYCTVEIKDLAIIGDGVNSRYALNLNWPQARIVGGIISNFVGAGIYITGAIKTIIQNITIGLCGYGIQFNPSGLVSTTTVLSGVRFSTGNNVCLSATNCTGVHCTDQCIFESCLSHAIIADCYLMLRDPYFENVTGNYVRCGANGISVSALEISGGVYVGGGYSDITEDAFYLDNVVNATVDILYTQKPCASVLRTTANTGIVSFRGARNIVTVSAPDRQNGYSYAKGTQFKAVCDDGVTRVFVVSVAGTSNISQPVGYTRTTYDFIDGTMQVRSCGQVVPYNQNKLLHIQPHQETCSTIELMRTKYVYDGDIKWYFGTAFTYGPGEIQLYKQDGLYTTLYVSPTEKIALGSNAVSSTHDVSISRGCEFTGSTTLAKTVAKFNQKDEDQYITEWQTNGTVMSRIDSTGGFYTGSIRGTAEVVSNNILGAYTNTPVITTGTLPAGKYYYKITSLTTYGESTPDNEASQTLIDTGGLRLTWVRIAGATGYKIYATRLPGGSGSELLLTTIGNGYTTTFTDDGSLTPAGSAPPIVNTSGGRFCTSSSNTGIYLQGNRSAGDSGTDVIIKSTATRSNGNLLDTQNNGVSKFSVDYAGNVTAAGIVSASNITQYIKVPFTYSNMGGSVSSTATIPVGAYIVSSRVIVNTAFNNTVPTCGVMVDGTSDTNIFAADGSEVDLSVADQYNKTDAYYIDTGFNGPVKVTLGAGTASAGSGVVLIGFVTPLT